MWLLQWRELMEIWRRSEKPSWAKFRSETSLWQRVVYLALPFVLLGALFVPWLAFRSFVVGAVTYVLASLVLIAVLLVTSARRLLTGEAPAPWR